jgi:YD repeat-containing protein
MKTVIVYGLLCILSFQLTAQNHFTLPQVTPKSPNAASIERYGTIPVSLSTGAANFSIPLYEIASGEVKVPITLSWNNNGLRIDDIASWVGHGWSLKVGGQVSVEERGTNDFDPNNGIFSHNHLQDLSRYFENTMSTNEKREYFERIIARQEDSEFDIFHYSFPGGTGSFYFNQQQQAITMPKNDNKIYKTPNGFRILGIDGTTYYFESQEQSIMTPSASLEVVTPFVGTSAFHLSTIQTKSGRLIKFVYKNYNFQYTKNGLTISHMGNSVPATCPHSSIDAYGSYSLQSNLLLDSILFDEGSVKFINSGLPREDIKKIDPQSAVPSLSSIIIRNYRSKVVRQYDFSYGYFSTNERLKLKTVTEKNQATTGRSWSFDYYNENSTFPSFFSMDKDHWGYHNAAGNISLIPQADYQSFIPYWTTTYTQASANRNSNATAAQMGMLQKITYPTGGTTTIEYEPNQVSITSYQQITQLSPYLKPASIATNGIPIVDAATSNSNSTVSGSFVIGSPTLTVVSGFTQNDPSGFYNALITLTGPPQSVSDIYSATQTSCNANNTYCSGEKTVLLEPGTYTYALTGQSYVLSGTTYYVNCGLKITKENPPPYHVGGCRVARITNTDLSGVNPSIVKRYVYNDNLSQLAFRNIPYYHTSVLISAPGVANITCIVCATQYKIHEYSVKPFAGSNVQYRYVTEYSDEMGKNGKTEYTFWPSDNINSINTEPYVSPINTSWRDGIELVKSDFLKSPSNFTLIQKNESGYALTAMLNQTSGIKVDYSSHCQLSSDNGATSYRISASTLSTEKIVPQQSIKTQFDASRKIEQKVFSEANSNVHSQITMSKNIVSNSVEIKDLVKYPSDYANVNAAVTGEAYGIKNLVSANIVLPIEKLKIRTVSGIDYVVGALITIYKENALVPDKILGVEPSEPILLSSFTQSYITPAGVLVKDPRYKEKVLFQAYDGYNNPLSQSKINNIFESYIWDYKKLYPIAKVINAAPSDIAFSSFEAEENGNWSFSGTPNSDATAPTGSKVYSLSSGDISKSISISKSYIISFWSKGAVSVAGATLYRTGKTIAGWTYAEYVASNSGSVSLTGTGQVDELALYPKGAQISTFTYEPLVGLVAQADINGNILYYEYDALGRLKYIRDTDKNIIKVMDYQYQVTPNQ